MVGTLKNILNLREAFDLLGLRNFPDHWTGDEWKMLPSSEGRFKRIQGMHMRARHVLNELRYYICADVNSVEVFNAEKSIYEKPRFYIDNLFIYDSLCADEQGHMYRVRLKVEKKSIFFQGPRPKERSVGRPKEIDWELIEDLMISFFQKDKERNIKQAALVHCVVEKFKREGWKVPHYNSLNKKAKEVIGDMRKLQKSNNN